MSSTAHGHEPPAAEPGALRKVVRASAIGNFVEWYDFAIYGYLASTLATNFFPSADRTASVLATLATFAVAFGMRPVGALVFGVIGDRVGRRTTLATVILLMSLSTVVIGLLPTHGTIGVWAPMLLVVARCLQGLSAGGEYGGASSMVAEYAPHGRRGFYVSFLSVSTASAFIAAALLIAALSAVSSEAAFESWVWRVPFLLALPVGLIGLYIRLRLEDTPAFRAVAEAGRVEPAPLSQTLRTQWRRIGLLSGFIASNALGFYFLATYFPTYLKEEADFSNTAASLTNAAALVVVVVGVVAFGRLSDRVGRKPLMLATSVLFFVLALPSVALAATGVVVLALLGQMLFAVAQAASQASTAVVMTEMFPTRLRYTGASVSYNLAYMVFGGTAPLIGTALTGATGSGLPAGVYVAVVALLSLACVLSLPESRDFQLLREGDADPGRFGRADRAEAATVGGRS